MRKIAKMRFINSLIYSLLILYIIGICKLTVFNILHFIVHHPVTVLMFSDTHHHNGFLHHSHSSGQNELKANLTGKNVLNNHNHSFLMLLNHENKGDKNSISFSEILKKIDTHDRCKVVELPLVITIIKIKYFKSSQEKIYKSDTLPPFLPPENIIS